LAVFFDCSLKVGDADKNEVGDNRPQAARKEIFFVPEFERMILISLKSEQFYFYTISVRVPNPKVVRVTKSKVVRVTFLLEVSFKRL